MASIIINVETDSGRFFDRTIELADADLLRILRAANSSYLGDKTDPPYEILIEKKDAAFNRAVDIFFGEIRRMTRDYEVGLARLAAEATVSSIEEIRNEPASPPIEEPVPEEPLQQGGTP